MVAKKPQVSIILPIYNVEKYLPQAIESVVNQTLADIEIILVNDGSPDRCKEIIDKFAASDVRVKTIHKKNEGYGSAINVGLDIALGEYLGIVETDDYIAPHMYETLLGMAKHYDADISRGSYNIFNTEGIINQQITLGAGIGPFNLNIYPDFLVTPPAIWSAIYRTSLIKEKKIKLIDTPRVSYQDVDFFVRTSVFAERIICTNKPLYYYRLDNASSSSNNSSKIEDIFNNYKITDSFMESEITVTPTIMAYYNKRKVCDIIWHFNRVNRIFWNYFINMASQQFKKISDRKFEKILDIKQFIFYKGITNMPHLFLSYKLLEHTLKKSMLGFVYFFRKI